MQGTTFWKSKLRKKEEKIILDFYNSKALVDKSYNIIKNLLKRRLHNIKAIVDTRFNSLKEQQLKT